MFASVQESADMLRLCSARDQIEELTGLTFTFTLPRGVLLQHLEVLVKDP